MPNLESTATFKANIASLKKEMQAAGRAIRKADAEFKAATAGMDNWGSSADGLEAKLKQLGATLQAQKSRYEQQKQILQQTIAAYGENSAAADRERISLLNMEAAMKKTESQIKGYEDALEQIGSAADEAAKGTDKYQTATEKLSSKIDEQESELEALKSAYKDALLDENTESAEKYAQEIKQLSGQLKDSKAKMEQADKAADELDQSLDEAGDSAERASDGFTVMKGVIANLASDVIRRAVEGFKDLAKEVYNAGANFEASMSQVEAISGASGSEMEELTAKAKEMGETTKYSASESADAFNYMAMAGWKTEDMINGIGGVMNLAAASGEDLATTSDIVTDALTAMGYSAGDAGKLADVMAAASSNANTNVGLMGATFQYAAPIIGALGYNMEDAAVAIGLMANAGIKGQKAGTALRSILTRLSAPPKECASEMEELGISLTDSEGNMKSMSEVIGDLRQAFSKLSETEQTGAAKHIAGAEAMSGLLAIVNAAPEDFDKLTSAVQNSTGAAQSMADTMNDNVSGQVTLLRSKVEGIMIKVFEKMSGSIRKALETISKALDKVDWNKFAKSAGDVAARVGDFFAFVINHAGTIVNALKAIAMAFITYKAVSTITSVIGAFTGLFNAVKSGTSIFQAFTTAVEMNPIGLIAAGVAAAVTAFIAYSKAETAAMEAQYGLNAAQQEAVDKANEVAEAYENTERARREATDNVSAEFGYIQTLKDEYNGLVDANGRVKDGYKDRADFILNQLAEALGVERSEIQKNIEKNGQMGASIDELIKKKQAEITLSANESAYTEAVQKQSEALQSYMTAIDTTKEREAAYIQARSEWNAAWQEYNEMLSNGNSNADQYLGTVNKLREGMDIAKGAWDESTAAAAKAESAYVGYSSTIRNYENLSQAIISGSETKIKNALTNMQTNFVTAKDGTKTTLEQQVSDLESTYTAMQQAVTSGMGGVTQEQVDAAKSMVDAAKTELEKFESSAAEAGEKAGEGYADGVKSADGQAKKSGQGLGQNATKGAAAGASDAKKKGKASGDLYAKGVESAGGYAKKSGQSIGRSATSGANSGGSGLKSTGSSAGGQYASGISSKGSVARSAGTSLGNQAKSGAGSVSAEGSGQNFGQGFINGIGTMFGGAFARAAALARQALAGIRSAQKEGSPSKLTYQSGVYFTQGYINGIVSLEKNLVSTVKNMVGNVTKYALDVKNWDFTAAGQNAGTAFGTAMANRVDYIIARIQYMNEQKIAEFDADVARQQSAKSSKANQLQAASNKKQTNLAAQRDKKVAALQKKYNATSNKTRKANLKTQIQNTKNYYNNLIKAEKNVVKNQINNSNKSYDSAIAALQKNKDYYTNAAQNMITEFSKAVTEYQNKAQALIDSTIGGVTEAYNDRYNELINKQDNLIDKLREAGDLFDISNAGVMTVNDLKAQTRAITEYANNLKKIKERVSAELFDEIASFDMTEGSAFLNRLLAMSASDLDAYNKAYLEKMEAARKAGDELYKADFDKLATDYESNLKKAMDGLPAQLEALGQEAMKGFVDGLTQNTDYMNSSVRTFVNGMVNQFKSLLKIQSPSKVMFGIGEYTGEGFDNGLMSVLGAVQDTVKQLTNAVSTPLSDMTGNMGRIQSAVRPAAYGSTANGSVVNNYNLVQNNNSPKSLSALETYQARRQQLALVKAFA